MPLPDFNIIFVIWRESVEALLVVGVLAAWLALSPPERRRKGRLWLWGGVAAGVLGALALAALMVAVGEGLDDDAQTLFQTGVMLAAVVLIVQMTVWMRRNGAALASNLHASLDEASAHARWYAVFALAFLAVLREGAEAAVFMYGAMASAAVPLGRALASTGLGLAAAIITCAALQAMGRRLPWRVFFRVSEVLLLLLAGGLLIQAVDNLLSLGLLPELSGRLWDSTRILPDGGQAGGMFASLTGYRARPVLIEVLVLGAFWITAPWLLHRLSRARA